MTTAAFLRRLWSRILRPMNPEIRTFQVLDGGIIDGASDYELACKLRAGSREPGATLEAFMAETALACYIYSSAVISTVDTTAFIADLVGAGFLIDPAAAPPNVLPFPAPSAD